MNCIQLPDSSDPGRVGEPVHGVPRQLLHPRAGPGQGELLLGHQVSQELGAAEGGVLPQDIQV